MATKYFESVVKMWFNKRTGNIGESIACNFLKQKGFKIVSTNFFAKGGEIDIVALDKDVLVFVEVKTRNSKKFGLPQEAITQTKICHMKTAALAFLQQKNLIDKVQIRFDCIAILHSQDGDKIEHIENIIF